ncbi:MAG: hypothetical protein WC939_00365 [Acholeplasmataceae bacterium]
MRTKVKPEQLKLGDVLYFVDMHHLTKGVQQATVLTLSLNDKKEVTFRTDNELETYHLNSWNKYVSRSELKAKRVYVNLLEAHNRRKFKWQTEREIYHENLKNLVEVGKNYVGKTVTVKFKRYGKEISHYEKVEIVSLEPTYKKGEYSFETKPTTNRYLTTREGKNWYFWSELDELKQQKETIEKRIKELENE